MGCFCSSCVIDVLKEEYVKLKVGEGNFPWLNKVNEIAQ